MNKTILEAKTREKGGKARHLTLAPGLCNLELLDY